MSSPGTTTGHAAFRDYPLNAWYAAAWDHEVERNLLAKTIAGRPIVFYRTTAGRAVALADACWHRCRWASCAATTRSCAATTASATTPTGAPPSCQPRTRSTPARPCTPTPPSRGTAKSGCGPATRRWPMPTPCPTCTGTTTPTGRGRRQDHPRQLQLPADRRQPDGPHARAVRARVEHRARCAVGVRLRGHPHRPDGDGDGDQVDARLRPPPFWKRNLQDQFPDYDDYDGLVDRWQIIKYTAPSTVAIDVGVAKAGTGAPEGDRSQGVTGTVINTMTPETDNTCFYLWAFARDWCLDKQVVTTRLREGVSGVFFEDEVMLEAQQRGIEANPGYDVYNLNIDAGSMWTRRIVARMIAAEQGTDTGRDNEHADHAAAALSAVAAAENARVEHGEGRSGTGMEAEVTEGVAKHWDQPAAGLMARGL